MLAMRELTRELAAEGLAPLSPTELGAAAVIVYDRARHEWLQASKAQRSALRETKPTPRDDDTDTPGRV